MDADDIQLVEMLADLAEENEIKTNIDNDSVLGSQYSNEPVKNDPEEEIEDLNITSLDLDDLSSWESMHKRSNQHSIVGEIINDKQNMESMDDLNVNEESDINITLTNFPQLDGIHDLYGNMLDYEKETVNDLSNIRMIFKNDTAAYTAAYTTDQCLSENNKYVAAIVNTRKDYAMCNSYKNLYLVDIIEIANNPDRYYLKKKLYNFLNRYYFYIFMKTSKNLQNSQIDSTVVRKMYYLENHKRRIVHNKKMKKELCVTRYQLQTDHRDLDVYDIDEIGTFECLEHINQYYITDYKKDKFNYKQDSKSCVQQNIFLNINHRPSNFPMKFIISSVDGATATDSSDSESEVDITIDGQEKRVCVYKSGKTNARQNMIQITPKKRKLDFKQNDDYESPSKRRNMAVKTPKRKYNSPNKVPRSPQLSGNYSPLDITITSPKTSRSPVRQHESPKSKQYVPISDISTTSTTPKRKTRSLRVSLLCEKRLTNLSNLDLGNLSHFIIFIKNLFI